MSDDTGAMTLSSPFLVAIEMRGWYTDYFDEERDEELANLFLADGSVSFQRTLYKNRASVKQFYGDLFADAHHNKQRRYRRRIIFLKPQHTSCELYPRKRIIHRGVGIWQRIYETRTGEIIEERHRSHIFVIADWSAEDLHSDQQPGIQQLIIGHPFLTRSSQILKEGPDSIIVY